MADKGPTEAQAGASSSKASKAQSIQGSDGPHSGTRSKNKHLKKPIEQDQEQEEDSDPQS